MELSRLAINAVFGHDRDTVAAEVHVMFLSGGGPDEGTVNCEVIWPLDTRPGLARVLKGAGFSVTGMEGEQKAEREFDMMAPADIENRVLAILSRAHPRSIGHTEWVWSAEPTLDSLREPDLCFVVDHDTDTLHITVANYGAPETGFANEDAVAGFLRALRVENAHWDYMRVIFQPHDGSIVLHLQPADMENPHLAMSAVAHAYINNPPNG